METKKQGSLGIFHLLAILTVGVWGTTFVSTKILLNNGLNPSDIFFYRFLLAYVMTCCFSYKQWFARNILDELKMGGAGLCGGSIYFLTENTALKFTLASNVSLILCTAPLFTAVLLHFFYKKENRFWNRNFVVGSLLALVGMVLVIFNGKFVLQLSPKGDLLCLAAALCWGFYTVLLKNLENKYSNLFITRKVFFYGLITILPVFLVHPLCMDLQILKQSIVFGNLLFLGIIASMLCFLSWNLTLKRIGALKATNYIYLSPLITTIASFVILKEPITSIAMLGAGFIIFGVFYAERKKIK
ncbi:MAG: DMT family transporter [Bacteroidales bacterium]